MKAFNNFFVGIPIGLALLGFIWNELWGIGALFMILTGLVQVVGAFVWMFDDGLNNALKIYWILTISFFLMWIFTEWQWIWLMPPVIAIYYTILVNHYFKTDSHENINQPDTSV